MCAVCVVCDVLPTRCLVEALGADAWEAKKEVIDKADLVRLWEASPIAHVTHVKTPTMVQISFDDRDIPHIAHVQNHQPQL